MRSCLLALALALVSTAFAYGQRFLETFDAGFTPALGWAGDLTAFVGEDGRLVLRDGRAEPSAQALIWAPARTREAACWSLDLRQAFSASPANRLRWWLAADRPLDEGGVAGVYLDVGGVSGGEDALRLFYESGAGTTLVAAGAPGFAAVDPLEITVEVCATAARAWRVEAADARGVVVDSASGTAPVALTGEYVGLDVRFTATRNGRLSLDDLLVAPITVDTEAPRLVLAKAPAPQSVLLVASEPLGQSAAAASDYRVGDTAPVGVEVVGDTVRLSLTRPLPDGVPVLVEVDEWEDLAGNVAEDLTAEVTYAAPQRLTRYDVLVTEVMADPTPAIGLPPAEFVELYNASRSAIRLSALTIDRGGAPVALPDTLLPPGAYLALAGDETGDARFVVFDALPTLPNGGATLRLRDGARVVDEVTYDDAYHTAGKRDGGYSLERRDLTQPCLLGAANWASSRALSGGTPGTVNSVDERLPTVPLRLVSAEVGEGDVIEVTVNRALGGVPTEAFTLDGVALANAVELDAGRYVLTPDPPLVPGQIARLALATAAGSCIEGEVVDTATLTVGVPEAAAPGDWALSEIMYDPLAGEGRWVELYNRGERLLSLDGLLLAEADDRGDVLEAFDLSRGGLVAPGAYVVAAADPEALLSRYPTADEAAVIEADVPTLGEEACLLLADPAAGERYFLVCYSGAWHNRAFAKTDGVSLERIDLDAPAGDGVNWTSAASTAGFATPTLPNSQARREGPRRNAAVALQGERFSPDGDGFEDLLTVDYAFDAPGTLVSFEVVDLQGRSLYRPAEEAAVARRGVWTWDGVTDERGVVGIGTYVLRVEYWSEDSVAGRAYLPFSVVGF